MRRWLRVGDVVDKNAILGARRSTTAAIVVSGIRCIITYLLIPVLAGVGYEILKLGAKFRHNPFVRVIMYPGILVQMITTKRPTDDMIEVAITSMEEALVAECRR